MNTELFVNTKYILSFAIACYRLSYLAIVHMNYCLDFSTCMYCDLTNCKIGLLKPRSTGKQDYFQLYTIQSTSLMNTKY